MRGCKKEDYFVMLLPPVKLACPTLMPFLFFCGGGVVLIFFFFVCVAYQVLKAYNAESIIIKE